jgi:hypothetical protein
MKITYYIYGVWKQNTSANVTAKATEMLLDYVWNIENHNPFQHLLNPFYVCKFSDALGLLWRLYFELLDYTKPEILKALPL